MIATLETLSRRAALTLGALGALAAPAWACPTCSLSQGVDTLIFVLAFMVVPYAVVSLTWMWLKRILRQEQG